MGRLINFILLAALLAGAYIWITPYRSVQKLVQAMENENAAQVDAYVDFDAVRVNFQNDFATRMNLQPEGNNTLLGNIIASGIAGAFINSIVSPDTMVSVLKDHDRRERLGLSDDLGTLIKRGAWINTDQFVLYNDQRKPTMLLQRHGIQWEVTAISLK